MVKRNELRWWSAGLLLLIGACGSSSPAPIDELATQYCDACCDPEQSCRPQSCPTVITRALNTACPDETNTYYRCVTDNACNVAACETEWDARSICMNQAPSDSVRNQIASLSSNGRVANLGHRGTGPTREGHPYPENSISSFLAAIEQGADGIELDVEITSDGEIVVMHDDTVDRTTDCTGCVSQMTLAEVRSCRLLGGDGAPTEERPPTLAEVYAAVGGNALINVELKVFSEPCLSEATGAEALARKAIEEVARLGEESRSIFSSFDESAVATIEAERPGLYTALLSREPDDAFVQRAASLRVDAIHPFISVTADTVQLANEEGLQANVWIANTRELMQQQIEKGVDTILTDDPATLAALIEELQSP